MTMLHGPRVRFLSVLAGDTGGTGDNRRKPRLSRVPGAAPTAGDTGDKCRANCPPPALAPRRGHFPSDDAALKLLFLALNRTEKEWTMPPREWSMAKAQFAVLFGERFTRAMA